MASMLLFLAKYDIWDETPRSLGVQQLIIIITQYVVFCTNYINICKTLQKKDVDKPHKQKLKAH